MAGLVTWADIMQSPEYSANVQQIQAALGRQFRAVPSAAPELRQAATQEGVRLSKLRDLSSASDIANRRLGLQQQRLTMERDELNRYEKRLPYANLVGVGNVIVGGLSAYGNLAASRRSEARYGRGRQFQAEAYQATAQGLQGVRSQQQRMEELYRQLASGYSRAIDGN